MTARPVLLVHGGWGGAWAWEKVVPGLEECGLSVEAVDLPLTSLEDDAAVVRDALDRAAGPTVVCGHSYGGAVITAGAAGHANADHLVYLCAFMPDAGETVVEITSWAPPPAIGGGIEFADDGTCTIPVDVAIAGAYADCDAAEAAAAAARFRPHHAGAFVAPIGAAAWHDVPSTYVVCEADFTLNPEIQRKLAQRASETVTFPTGHAPQLARPDLVVDLLARVAGG
jgi:pimeloyl-ACP methyl ester carboxylesterase